MDRLTSKLLDHDTLGHGYLYVLITKINKESEKCTIRNFCVVQKTRKHWQERLTQLEEEKPEEKYQATLLTSNGTCAGILNSRNASKSTLGFSSGTQFWRRST